LIQILEGGAIFGGARFTKNAAGTGVVDNGTDKTGFMLGTDGVLKASNVDISGKINATSGVFSGITIKSGYGVNNNPSSGTLLKSISGYVQDRITLDSGWYYVDMAGGGGGDGGKFSAGSNIQGSPGGRIKYVFNIVYDGIIAYLYSGSRGEDGLDSRSDPGAKGKGWSINIYNTGDVGGDGGIGPIDKKGSKGGNGSSLNGDDAQDGAASNGYNNGSGAGGGGNSILYIPAIGLTIFCSGGGGAAGSGENGNGTRGTSGKDSIFGNLGSGNNEDGYVKIYKL
jgi:hypothetical protein